MHPLGMAGLFKIFLAELFLAAAAGTANIAVCRNVDENCWVIRDVVASIVSIGMAVDHKNVLLPHLGQMWVFSWGRLIPFYGIL